MAVVMQEEPQRGNKPLDAVLSDFLDRRFSLEALVAGTVKHGYKKQEGSSVTRNGKLMYGFEDTVNSSGVDFAKYDNFVWEDRIKAIRAIAEYMTQHNPLEEGYVAGMQRFIEVSQTRDFQKRIQKSTDFIQTNQDLYYSGKLGIREHKKFEQTRGFLDDYKSVSSLAELAEQAYTQRIAAKESGYGQPDRLSSDSKPAAKPKETVGETTRASVPGSWKANHRETTRASVPGSWKANHRETTRASVPGSWKANYRGSGTSAAPKGKSESYSQTRPSFLDKPEYIEWYTKRDAEYEQLRLKNRSWIEWVEGGIDKIVNPVWFACEDLFYWLKDTHKKEGVINNITSRVYQKASGWLEKIQSSRVYQTAGGLLESVKESDAYQTVSNWRQTAKSSGYSFFTIPPKRRLAWVTASGGIAILAAGFASSFAGASSEGYYKLEAPAKQAAVTKEVSSQSPTSRNYNPTLQSTASGLNTPDEVYNPKNGLYSKPPNSDYLGNPYILFGPSIRLDDLSGLK